MSQEPATAPMVAESAAARVNGAGAQLPGAVRTGAGAASPGAASDTILTSLLGADVLLLVVLAWCGALPPVVAGLLGAAGVYLAWRAAVRQREILQERQQEQEQRLLQLATVCEQLVLGHEATPNVVTELPSPVMATLERVRSSLAATREDALHANERADLLLHTVGEGIYSLDDDMRITSFNPAAEKLTGVTASEAANKHCWDVFKGKDREGTLICCPDRCHVRRALQAGDPLPNYELRLGLKDESSIDMAFLPRRLVRPGGQVEVVSTFRDVTFAREMEQMRNNLLNTVTHELKTPITSIKGCVATLSHPKANFTRDAQKNFLNIIGEEADRLNRLVTDLLQAAQVTSDVLTLQVQSVSLRPLVERVMLRYEGLSKRHTFMTDWLSECNVAGDAERLEYVLQHLVSNAVKFSPQGGEVRVTVRDHKDESLVYVLVQDQGMGVPMHQRDRIFEVFHRLDVADNRKTYGVGTGLYLARKILQAHGGRIWVDSVLGGGSCFTFTLPVKD